MGRTPGACPAAEAVRTAESAAPCRTTAFTPPLQAAHLQPGRYDEQAAGLFAELARDYARVCGADDHRTPDSRLRHAQSTGESGNPVSAVELLDVLAQDYARIRGVDHADTRDCRHLPAVFTKQARVSDRSR